MSLTHFTDKEKALVRALVGMMDQFSCDFMSAGERACATLGHAVQTNHHYNESSFVGIPCHCLDRTAYLSGGQVDQNPDLVFPHLSVRLAFSDITKVPR